MAITNREILQNQLRRINEKMKTNFSLENVCGRLFLTEDNNFGKISANFTQRSSAQMIEYLSGLEDAIDIMPKKVYFVKCEGNDQGWHAGYHHFTKLEDAIKLMRNYVAHQLWYARHSGKKIFIKTFSDRVMGDVSKNPQKSQTIFVRIEEDTFEYRIWSEELNYSELPKNKCINY